MASNGRGSAVTKVATISHVEIAMTGLRPEWTMGIKTHPTALIDFELETSSMNETNKATAQHRTNEHLGA